MAEPNKMLEETANYLLNHCFLLGGVEDQRAKYLYVQDHLPEVRAVFAPLGYAVLLYPAPLQAAALVNEHEGSQARLLKYESILLLVLRLLYLQKRENLSANADQVLVTVEELRRRLNGRGTDAPEVIEQRLAKASYELTFAPQFDHVVVNDNLEKAQQEVYQLVKDFLSEE